MSIKNPPLRITDPAAFGRVAVLMGGSSSEREVSLDSGRNVLDALRSRGVDANAVDGIPNLIRELNDKQFDRVFNILHGGDGENGVLQGLLQGLGMPFTGSGVLGSALGMDKTRTKQVWLSMGLPTPRYRRLAKGVDVGAAARDFGFPVIVKPPVEGSSVGIHRIFDENDLKEVIAFAAEYPDELLMEQLIVGDELTVGVLDGRPLPSIRIVPSGEYYDYHAKYVAEDTEYLCPGLQGADEDEIRRIALAAFNAVGCSAWGRVDVMRDRESGQFHLLEVNTAPGMTSHSLVPKAAREAGASYEELCWRILEQTLPEVRA